MQTKKTVIILFDAAGKKHKEVPSTLHLEASQLIDISELKTGMYFLTLINRDGNYVKSFHKL